jgi:hypothetical protein
MAKQNCLPHGQKGKERKRKGLESHSILQGQTPSDLKTLTRLYFLKVHHLVTISPWDKVFIIKVFGHVQDPTITVG